MTWGALVRWQFYDPATGTHMFAMNPDSGGTPKYAKTITEVPTTAGDGRSLLFEGSDVAAAMEFSGIVHDLAEADVFVQWFGKHRQVRVTDDLGRQFWIFLTGLEITRKRSRNFPAKATFKVTAVILDSDASTPTPPDVDSRMLMETGDGLLMETGDTLLLESA